MPDKVVNRIIDSGIESGRLVEAQKETYKYGYTLLVETAACTICTIAIAVAFGKIIEMLLFSICFIPLRSFGGGYHAATAKRCFVLSALVMILFCLIVESEMLNEHYLILALAATLGFGLVCKFAPQISRNDIEIERRCKKITILLYLFYLLTGYILHICGLQPEAVCINLALIFWVVSLMVSVTVKD